MEIAKYQFHSWTRRGIASMISEKDDLGANTSTTKERVGISLPVLLNDSALSKNFNLIGPGDIIGVNRDMIVRTCPLNWITNFEANYLALIEFYDEDFLWRYTPASADGKKLRPWLFLLVLKEGEFDRTSRTTPLPSITLKSPDVFPPANESWLWAHVHNDMNVPADQQSNFADFVNTLNANVNTDPDQLYCRLLSPRKLEANIAYHAFLIPAFESGRLAGLEQATDEVNAQAASWKTPGGANGEMPVYFEWYFRTSEDEDFESLVKKLKPQPMDPKVGIRDMDCSSPGFVKADGTPPFPGTSPPTLGLEGALKSPTTVSTVFPDPGNQNTFQVELEKIVNLPFNIKDTDITGDPLISVPFYGNMHAKTSATDVPLLDITNNSWLHDLNKDPRTRAAAGMGTHVVQKGQEDYMRKAWAQVQKIIEANRRIRHTVLYMKVASQFAKTTFTKLQPAELLSISKPVLSRIMGSPTTIYQQLVDSPLPVAVFTGSFRRLTAPKRRVAKLNEPTKKIQLGKLVTALNEGTVTAAPPKQMPLGTFTTDDMSAKILSEPGAGAADKTAAQELVNPQLQLSTLKQIPQRPDFTLKLSDEASTPPPTTTTPGEDSVEAKNYRQALTDMTKRVAAKGPEKTVTPFNLANASVKIKDGIDPNKTFPRRLLSFVKFPGNIQINGPQDVFPAMAYPDLDDPMYKGLADISSELLLPNLKLVPDNCISLLNTNPKYIESYMVGLNHEMGHELLWREYPTDQRGSYFRQFWDVNGIIAPASGQTPAQQTEANKDITPIDTWTGDSALGSHNNRQLQNAKQLVLVIRGEILKKYPIIVSMQKAVADGSSDTKIETDLSDADFAKNVKFPIFKADVSPDIKFFGFDITAEKASGTELSPGFTDNLGWYFVLMQIPGTPVFGMDVSFDPGDGPLTWDDLSWDKLPEGMKFISAAQPPSIAPAGVQWGADAASMAYILFQEPVMVAVHAKQMLAKLTS